MLKRISLFLLIFSLPFQLGYHFWLPESYVRSFRIDYLSPTLYLTDIIILAYILLNLPRALSIIKNFFSRPDGWLFLLLILINSYTSAINPITLFAWVRLSVYFLLLAILASTPKLSQSIRLPFTLSLVFIIGHSLIQFLRQSSLGGLFYLFGERPLSVALPNVAKLSISSLGISNSSFALLRPYATFSHPNSLAGYLLVSLLILRQISSPKPLKIITIVAIVLTFSKSALLTLAIISLVNLNLSQSFLISTALSFLPLLKLGLSFSSRFYLLAPTLRIVSENLLLGVGLRQFIPTLAIHLPGNQLSYSSLQPVHNLLLLAVSELGLIPVVMILYLLIKSKFILNTKYYLLVTVILLTGSLDHYWWTLPQNQLIIVLALALIINPSTHFPSKLEGKASPSARKRSR